MALLTPFANRALVQIEKDEVGGGLIVPKAHERSLEKAVGEIIEVGSECQYVKVGMRVLLSKYAGIEVQIMDVSYRIMHEDDIAGQFHEQAASADTKTEESLQ